MWSTYVGDPALYVKYDWNQLNILDPNKKTLILKNPIQLGEESCNYTYLIYMNAIIISF